MKELIYIQKTFEKVNLTDTKINQKEFEDCVFKQCDFSNSDFSNNVFMDCVFTDCNLSNLKLINTSLKTVVFQNCKLIGIPFHTCNDFLFSVEFKDSILDFASFSSKKMIKTIFNTCSIKEVSFERANLTNSLFDNCNLDNSIFNDSILVGVDFSSAYNYKIDPEFNTVKNAKFSIQGIAGLLSKYDIKIV